ncbi:hypothetical protein Tco_0559461, partial [Tanacetum coccineum]
PSFVPRAAYVPAGSRNSPASISAGSAFPAGSRNRPASIFASRPFSAGLAVITNYTWMREDGELLLRPQQDNPHKNKDLGIVDSGCSRSMTGNKEKLDDFVKIIGGTVTFGGGDGKITGKGTIRTSKLNFENVYYVEELQNFNLFSVSQICDKKNKVLFTDKECLVLTKEFQLPEDSQVVLRVPRRHNLYSFNLTKIQPARDITCPKVHIASATVESTSDYAEELARLQGQAYDASVVFKIIEVELDNVVEEEDGEWICFLGGNSSSGTKKYQGLNSSDGGNTGDGVKIAGRVIGSSEEIEFSEGLQEMLPDEAEK